MWKHSWLGLSVITMFRLAHMTRCPGSRMGGLFEGFNCPLARIACPGCARLSCSKQPCCQMRGWDPPALGLVDAHLTFVTTRSVQNLSVLVYPFHSAS